MMIRKTKKAFKMSALAVMRVLTIAARNPSCWRLPTSSRTGDYQQVLSLFTEEELGTKAFKAVAHEARVVAFEFNNKYVLPECVMLALLRQPGGIARDVLKKTCDDKLFERTMEYILHFQPPNRRLEFWASIFQRRPVVSTTVPIYRLEPLMLQAKKEMFDMKQSIITEEHLLKAYSKDDRYGKKVWQECHLAQKN